MVANINAIKDINGYYCKNFRKCVIIDIVENKIPLRQVVRKHWHTSSRREENLYTKTVRSWIKLFHKYGVYIMKDLNKIPLKGKDFTPTEELIKLDSVSDFDEAAKIIKKMQMALIYQNEVINLYKSKLSGEEPDKSEKKKN